MFFDEKSKIIALAVLFGLFIFFIGSDILYATTYPGSATQFGDLFKAWQGWLVIVAAIIAGAGGWWLMAKYKA